MASIVKAALIANLCILNSFNILPNNKLWFNNSNSGIEVSVQSLSFAVQVKPFDGFFKQFNRNTIFQLARIDFPLKTVMVEDDNKQTVKYINKREWKHTNLSTIKNIVITKHKVTKEEVTVLLQIKDTGIFTEYKFISKEGKWYLFLITDEST